MKLRSIRPVLALATALVLSIIPDSSAQEVAPAPPPTEAPAEAAAPALTIEQRLTDLEAYITNSAPGTDGETTWESKIAGPGPGHNAWQMVSTALVLFMTLPGLALFYGGLVGRKNVLPYSPNALASPGW